MQEIEGAERVAERVWRVPLRTPTLPPATHTNAYVVGFPDAIWVEPASPYPDEVQRALSVMDGFKHARAKFGAYFLTHHHPDHAGGLDLMQGSHPLPVWAHHNTLEALDLSSTHASLPPGSLPAPFSNWRAVHTPGHASGHYCLWREQDRLLIAGDMVASIGTIVVDPDEGDMTQYLESLELLAGLDARTVLPAHGDPVPGDRDIFRFYVQHRLKREAKVLAALQAEAQTLGALVRASYDDTPEALWPLAERSLLAHLRKLSKEGRAEEVLHGWRLATSSNVRR